MADQKKTAGGSQPERKTSPVTTAPPKAAKVAPKAAAPKVVRKPTYVRLRNKLSQRVDASVLHENGRDAVSLPLGPLETSRPVATDRFTAHTENLLAQGFLVTV